MSAAARQPVFVLADTIPGEDVGLVGLWRLTRPAPEDVSFSGEAGPPIWRVSLPQDLGAAAVELAAGERRLAGARRAVAQLRGSLPQVARAAGSPAATPDEAGERLAYALDTLPADERVPRADLGDLLAGGWDAAARQLRATLDVARRTALSYAFVETAQAGVTIARTQVAWGGGTTTVVLPSLAGERAALHRRSVRVAVSSRTALIQAIAVAAQLAAAVGFAGPLGVLPIAWRYVSRLL